MKKKLLVYVSIILMIVFIFNTKVHAITVPSLVISSTNYSEGDKMTRSDIVEVEIGETLQLYAMVAYGNDVYDPEYPDSMGWYVESTNLSNVTWTSSETNVATVDNTGKVTGISVGDTIITAKSESDEATYKIKVTPKGWSDSAEISFLDKGVIPRPTMVKNKNHNFILNLKNIPDSEKENIKIGIDDEKNAELTSIDNTTEGMIIANVKFLSLGKTKIYAELEYNGKMYKDTYEFEVMESMYKLSISSKEYTELPKYINAGETIQLNATFLILGGSVAPEDVTTSGTIWTSSDEEIATVNSQGIVTGKEAKGAVTITAKYTVGDEELIATYEFKVKETEIPETKPILIGEFPAGVFPSEVFHHVIFFVLGSTNDTLTKNKIINHYTITSSNLKDENKIGTGEKFASNNIEYTILVYGDVDGNGVIGIRDAREVAKHVANPENTKLNELQREAGDIYNNGDGLTLRDARTIAKYVSSKSNNYIIEK